MCVRCVEVEFLFWYNTEIESSLFLVSGGECLLHAGAVVADFRFDAAG